MVCTWGLLEYWDVILERIFPAFLLACKCLATVLFPRVMYRSGRTFVASNPASVRREIVFAEDDLVDSAQFTAKLCRALHKSTIKDCLAVISSVAMAKFTLVDLASLPVKRRTESLSSPSWLAERFWCSWGKAECVWIMWPFVMASTIQLPARFTRDAFCSYKLFRTLSWRNDLLYRFYSNLPSCRSKCPHFSLGSSSGNPEYERVVQKWVWLTCWVCLKRSIIISGETINRAAR